MRQLAHFFNLRDLEVRNDGEPFTPTEEFCRVKEREWKKLDKTTKRKRANLWNGVIYRLSKITPQKEKSILHLSTIDFKTHYATSQAVNFLKKIPFEKRPNGMYVGAYIKTSDGKLIFGSRSPKSVTRADINFIGGNLNKDEMEITCTKDLFNFFIKEFEEELGLNKKAIKTLSGLGIYISDNCRIGVVMACELGISEKTVMKNKKLNFEHQKLIFLTKKKFLNLLDDPRINANIRGSYRHYLRFN